MNNGPPDLQVNGKLDEPVALQEIGSVYKESHRNTCIHTSYLCYFICVLYILICILICIEDICIGNICIGNICIDNICIIPNALWP